MVLVLLAVGLGIAIYYKQYRPKQSAKAPDTQTNTEQKEAKPVLLSDPEYDKNLTAEQKQLFYSPGPDATAEEKQAYFDLATKVAKSGNIISINDCTASPDVLKVKLGENISVKNTGSADIKFGLGAANKVSIKAGQTVAVKDLFTKGAGLYGYGCENSAVRRAIGMVLITP